MPLAKAQATTVLDLFAGVGGASYGLALAGFDVLGVEFWRDAVQAHRTHGPCLEADLSTDDWMGGLPHLSWDGVWSSFPCQAWSNAGKRLGAKDPRNGWPWTVKCLRELRARGQARWFLAENVKGLLQHATSKGCKEGARLGGDDCPGCYFETVILVDLRDLFPVVDYRVLDAADFGVPQHRHRLILWGGPVPFRWPSGGYSGAALAWAKWGPEDEGGGEYWRSVGIPPVGGPSKEEERALRRARGGDRSRLDLRPWRTMRQALGLGVPVVVGAASGEGPSVRGPDGVGPTVTGMTQFYAGGEGHTAPYAFVRVVGGGGGNPHGVGRPEERTLRDLTDEPSTTMTAEQIGNAGPWVETRKGAGMADRGNSRRPVPVDEVAPTVLGPGDRGSASMSLLTDQTSERAGGRVPVSVPIDEAAPTMRAGGRGAPVLTGAAYADAPATVTTTEEKGTRGESMNRDLGDGKRSGGPDRASDALWLSTGRRRLEPVECAILQAFDEGGPSSPLMAAVASLPTKSAQYKAVGNAVPPTLAKVLGLAVCETLGGAGGERVEPASNEEPTPTPPTPATTFIEVCAGTAAVSLVLAHGPKAKPPVPRIGAKTGYAPAILDLAGLAPGQGALRYVWVDPEPVARRVLSCMADAGRWAVVVADVARLEGQPPEDLFHALDPSTDVGAVLLSRWSYRKGFPSSGFDRKTCAGRPDHGSKPRDAGTEARYFRQTQPVDGAIVLEASGQVLPFIDRNAVVYIDPPYVGTTGYRFDLPRAEVVELAMEARRRGARAVLVSEAEPIDVLVDQGWNAADITGTRTGQKRTFSKQQREWVTYWRSG